MEDGFGDAHPLGVGAAEVEDARQRELDRRHRRVVGRQPGERRPVPHRRRSRGDVGDQGAGGGEGLRGGVVVAGGRVQGVAGDLEHVAVPGRATVTAGSRRRAGAAAGGRPVRCPRTARRARWRDRSGTPCRRPPRHPPVAARRRRCRPARSTGPTPPPAGRRHREGRCRARRRRTRRARASDPRVKTRCRTAVETRRGSVNRSASTTSIEAPRSTRSPDRAIASRSSITKNGVPPARSLSSCTSRVVGWRPVRSPISCASSSASSSPRTMDRKVPVRASSSRLASLSIGTAGGGRLVATMNTRP